jgi:uncharacterized repeat protein (TIGR01451 family)
MPAREVQVRRDSRLFAEMCATLLRLGHHVQFRAHGQSMQPNLLDGDNVQVAPANLSQLLRGDVTLVENEDGLRVHRVSEITRADAKCITRADAGLHPDPVANRVLGKVVSYSRSGQEQSLGRWQLKVVHPLASMARRIFLAAKRRSSHFFGTQTLLLLFVLAGFSATPVHGQTADLALTQTVGATTVAPGASITYTEAVTNNGGSSADTPVLFQATPPNTTFVSMAAPGGWTCATPAGGGTGTVTCTKTSAGGAFTSGSVANFTFVVQVTAGTAAGTTIVNSANITSATPDNVPQNNATATTVLVEINGDSDLSVSMTASPSPVFISSTLTYTIQVSNLGLRGASNSSLTDTIPAGTTLVSATPSAGGDSCTQTATVTCNLHTIGTGVTKSVTIVVTVPGIATTLSNTATATTTRTDPVSGNNSATTVTVVQPISCALPGNDGNGTTITGVVNTYYPPSSATTLSAGSTTVTLGLASGAATPIAIGDLLLIIQMQDATLNSTNTGAYGDGVPGDPATGSLSLNSSGRYEFVTAKSAVPLAGGALTFSGSGAGSGALNTYTSAAFGTNGQKTFQVIRIPQYANATLGAALTAFPWNGSRGGVLAIDVAGQLNLNANTIDVSGLGFRGGAGRQLGGAAGTLATDYVTLATTAANGSKGEGIDGTPRYVANLTITGLTDTAVEGYPNGSYARGAAGNSGGGATDAHPTANDQNSGGGGGGNGGNGGYGGYGWNSAGFVGGHFGTAFPFSTNVIAMGGGGGAATTNDGTADPANGNPAGINSSGAAGGGIVVIRAGSVVGTGTINANGQSALNVQNDGGGGGGAGGSILVFANSGTLTGLTVNAIGGNGGNTWSAQAPGTYPGNRHGPGGGAGGGAVLVSSAPAAASSVSGGINGFSTTAQDAFGATPGQDGSIVNTNMSITQTPGTQAGAYCGGTDLSVTNSGAPPVVAAGGTLTYSQSVINNSPSDAVNVVFTEAIPANTTFLSIVPAAGWTCTTPAVGSTGNISCLNPDVAGATTSNFAVAVKVNAGVTNGTQIVSVDNVTSGTSDPNLANNSATAINTVTSATSADLTVTNTASAPVVTAGTNFTMTGVVTNQGPAAATNATFVEPIPANSTFVSLVPPAGWGCVVPPSGTATGTITCYASSTFASGASATFPVVFGVPLATPSGTVISATATVGSVTPDANPANNVATATTVVATAGQVDLSVSTAATPNPVSQGNNITYVQSVTNNGPTVETNATFTDTIPANTTLVSFTPPANWTCNTIAVGGTGTFTCTLNGGQTIAVGAKVNFPMVVKVNPATASGTTITNTVNVASTVSDPSAPNNTASSSTVVGSPTQSDVSITKTASPEPVNQNTNLTYTLKVTNGGPAIAQGITTSDTIPGEVTYVSSSTTQGGPCIYTTGTRVLSCPLGNLSVGSVALVTINVTPNSFSSASGSTNTATVASTTSDPNSANNTSSSFTTIQSPTAVDIASFKAISQPDGTVLLEWRTHEESRNLGFHLYREQGSARQRITPSLVAGSALLLRGSKPQHAAKLYRWIDPQPASGSVYWLEDVDINGTHTQHGPAYLEAASPERSAPAAARVQASPLLRELRAKVTTPAPSFRRIIGRPISPVPPRGTPRQSIADHDAVKIAVSEEGWYHVSLSDLYAAGLQPGTDPRSLRLFAEGIEQPLLVLPGGSNAGSSAAAIEFYGTGIDTPFSADRVYWIVSENQSGKRILPVGSAPSGSTGPSSFEFSVVRQDRTTYFAALLNGVNNDNFFGAAVTSDPVDQDLIVAHLDSSSTTPATLDISLQGATDQQDHRVTIQVNGSTVGLMDFQNQILVRQSFTVDSSLLHEGANTVTLTALNGDNDVSAVQFIQLNYAHTYAADSDWLRATVPPGAETHISGFTNPQIRLFDISDPLNITQLSGKITADAGSYSVEFVSPGNGRSARTILALAADAISAPDSLFHHVPSALDNQRVGADVIIVTHPDFSDDLAPLVSFRQSQGHRVMLVTTDQLYDEYNYGERSPFAIRSFLSEAVTRWQQKPQSVLLVGDASFDPRNYLGLGSFDLVPTRIIETAAFKTASDDWFTDFQSTGYATIPTGRLPVRTSADAQLLVSKIIGYEQGTYAGPWNGQALLVADQNINANFSSATVSAAINLPSSLQVSQILADGQDASAVRTQLLAALNTGSLFVNYQGHGAEQQWSFANLFDSDDASALTNGGRLPVYLLMDCLNGLFQDVYAESLAESVLLSPNGGGVAVWASSGFTEQAPQSSMNQAFLAQFAAHPGDSLGNLILRAKSGTTDDDVRKTWILFGDPAMKIHLVPSSIPSGLTKNSAHPESVRTPPARDRSECGPGRICAQRKSPL